MIEMNCPACGAEGRVPRDRLNTRLVCKKCLKVFHLTPSGRAVLGEPGPDPAASHATKSVHGDRTQDVDQWFERLGKRLASPAVLATLAVVVAAGGFLLFRPTRPAETLQDRVTRVAQAAVQGDLQTIRSLAATGTGDDVVRWYDAIRTRCDDLRQRLGSHALKVDVSVKQHDSDQGPVQVVALLDLEERIERRGNSLPDPLSAIPTASSSSLSMPMSWRAEGWSGWRLDGSKTLELAGTGP